MAKDLVRFGGVGSQVGQEPAKLLPKQEIGGKGLRYIDIGYHSFVPASMQYVVDTIRGSVQGSSVNTGQENFQLAVKDVGNKAEWKIMMRGNKTMTTLLLKDMIKVSLHILQLS